MEKKRNFRSSKNLKAVDCGGKEQSMLRLKVRSLEEQVQMLQKSNLNIFIPVSQHETKNTPNYEAIINKLKTQILSLQQQTQKYKTQIKKLQNEKEIIKINHQNEIKEYKQQITILKQQNQEFKEQVAELQQNVEQQKTKRKEIEKEMIEMRVQNRFLKQDIENCKQKIIYIEKRYEEMHANILAVNFHTRIYKSRQVKIMAIETSELKSLKAYIENLEAKIKQLLEANKQQKVTLGKKKENIGEEIVRLKKNIDLQLGLQTDNKATNNFLECYKDTNNKFNQLISACRK